MPLRVWVWAAATVVLVLVAVLLWHGSAAAAASSTTSGAAPAPTGTPADQLSSAWTTPTASADASITVGDRVLAVESHGVRLLDAADGAEAWHYLRSDGELCGATAVGSRVVALFRTTGRCNEIVALDAATGVRDWYRTVGFTASATLRSTDQIVLASTPTGIATIDPAGNNTRWRWAPPGGCRIADSGVGSAGVVVLQQCAGAAAVQVVLLDGFSGQQLWSADVAGTTADSAGPRVRLVGVGQQVSLVVGDELQVLARADGAATLLVPLGAGSGDPDDDPLLLAEAGTSTLIYARGTALAIDPDGTRVDWQLPAAGLPAVGGAKGGTLGTQAVLVPESGAFVQRDVLTGAELARSTIADPVPSGIRTATVGGVVVVTTGSELHAYR